MYVFAVFLIFRNAFSFPYESLLTISKFLQIYKVVNWWSTALQMKMLLHRNGNEILLNHKKLQSNPDFGNPRFWQHPDFGNFFIILDFLLHRKPRIWQHFLGKTPNLATFFPHFTKNLMKNQDFVDFLAIFAH